MRFSRPAPWLYAAVMALAAARLSPAAADTVTAPPGPAHATGLTGAGALGLPADRRPEPTALPLGPAVTAGPGRALTPCAGVTGPPDAAGWAAQGGAAVLLYVLGRRWRGGRRARRRGARPGCRRYGSRARRPTAARA